MTDRRIDVFVGLGIVAVVVMLPGLVLCYIEQPDFASAAGLGALSCLLATLVGGWRLGALVCGGLTLATGAALLCADNVLGAGILMFVVSAAAGLTARRGYSVGVIPAAITVAFIFAQPPQGSHATGSQVLDGAMTVLLSGVIAVVVGSLFARRGPIVTPVESSWSQTVNYALVLGCLVGISAAFVVSRQSQYSGAWLMMTILIVVQPSMRSGFRKSLERSVGTIVGVVIALVIGLIAFPATLVYLVAVAFLVFAVVLQRQNAPYWEIVAFLTPCIILIVGAQGSISGTAQDRLFATLLGAGAALVVIGFEGLVLASFFKSRASKAPYEGAVH